MHVACGGLVLWTQARSLRSTSLLHGIRFGHVDTSCTPVRSKSRSRFMHRCEVPRSRSPYINGTRRPRPATIDGEIDEKCEDMSASKRHLYLVLEDWEQGYTIRKIDVESFDDDATTAKEPESLPDPPVIRVEAEHGQAALFTALGTRILALLPRSAGAGAPVFDTATLGLVVAPQPPGDALAHCPTLVAVGGDRVYGLEGSKAGAGEPRELRHFEVLRAPAPPSRKLWSWSAVPSPPPFNPSSIVCYAVHPDARTVFFSAESAAAAGPSSKQAGGSGTFSFNTQRLEWTCHGRWLLPFAGQAHYDAQLDAWVGICGDDTDDGARGRGRVCCCDVVAPGSRRTPPPEWTLGEDPLFCEDEKRHAGAALVYMGGSRFCLLECVKPKAVVVERVTKPKAEAAALLESVKTKPAGMPGKKKIWKEKQRESNGDGRTEPSGHLLHVTVFGLKYGDQGELTAAAMRRQRRSYAVPEGAAKFLEKPVAFWM